jgi:hypothetical protein
VFLKLAKVCHFVEFYFIFTVLDKGGFLGFLLAYFKKEETLQDFYITFQNVGNNCEILVWIGVVLLKTLFSGNKTQNTFMEKCVCSKE